MDIYGNEPANFNIERKAKIADIAYFALFCVNFLLITRKVSILGYMLIHTLYVNMAILHNLQSFKNL